MEKLNILLITAKSIDQMCPKVVCGMLCISPLEFWFHFEASRPRDSVVRLFFLNIAVERLELFFVELFDAALDMAD